jgi:hypothetical protein
VKQPPSSKTPSQSATPPRVGAVTSKERTESRPALPASKGLPVAIWIIGVLALGGLVLYLLSTSGR